MKLRAVCLAAGVVLAVAGCQIAPIDTDKVTIVAGLYPYAWLAQAIGGDLVEVSNLTPPGAEPHDLELTARQVISIASADLAIYHSGLQPSVDLALVENPSARVIDVRTVFFDGQDKDHTLVDPHVWLDPVAMMSIAQTIAAALGDIDQENSRAYAEGLASLTAELTSLDQHYRTGLAHCERREFITTHDAFTYLAERYGLIQIPISGISPDADPSPARIAEIHAIATEKGLTTVFFETLASPQLARTIASDLGLATDVLDPLEGITEESRGRDYQEIMESNLAALREANGCS